MSAVCVYTYEECIVVSSHDEMVDVGPCKHQLCVTQTSPRSYPCEIFYTLLEFSRICLFVYSVYSALASEIWRMSGGLELLNINAMIQKIFT